MYLYLFFVIALGLAIPTFGASLLLFFFLKHKYDNRAVSALLAKAVTSMRTELTQELFRVNNAAVRNLFGRFCVGAEDGIKVGTTTLRWGVFSHPMIDQGRRFSLRVVIQTRGVVDIKAAPGINNKILSDHLDGIGSFQVAAMIRAMGE